METSTAAISFLIRQKLFRRLTKLPVNSMVAPLAGREGIALLVAELQIVTLATAA